MSTRPVDIQDSLAYHVHRAHRVLRRQFLRVAIGLGLELTPEQWFVLNKLRLSDGQSQSDLGERIFADRPSLTRMLSTMERNGLVRRQKDPSDKRVSLVFLTESGRALHDQFAAQVEGTRSEVFAGISQEELDQARAVLDRIQENLLDD